MRPLIKAELDEMVARGCTNPECHNHSSHQDLFLHSACHTDAGVEVSYKFGSGILKIACTKCHSDIIDIQLT